MALIPGLKRMFTTENPADIGAPPTRGPGAGLRPHRKTPPARTRLSSALGFWRSSGFQTTTPGFRDVHSTEFEGFLALEIGK